MLQSSCTDVIHGSLVTHCVGVRRVSRARLTLWAVVATLPSHCPTDGPLYILAHVVVVHFEELLLAITVPSLLQTNEHQDSSQSESVTR